MDALVAGIVLEASLLIDEHSSASLSLLHKLRHSSLHLGISYAPDTPDDKLSLIKQTAELYSCNCFPLIDSPDRDNTVLDWTSRSVVLYVVPRDKVHTFDHLSNAGWVPVLLDPERTFAWDNSTIHWIERLDELPLIICRLNRKAVGDKVVIIGYIMKQSREEDFLKRGAFPLYPTADGLLFLPISFKLPLLSQLQYIDVVLHKATDEIRSVESISPSDSSLKITYSLGMQELQRYFEQHGDCIVIDPLDKIYPVVDRLSIQQLLLELDNVNAGGPRKARGPHFVKLDDFEDSDLMRRIREAKLSFPSIVKPQVACGVADAHSMAIVFRVEDFKDLNVPLPAIIQEYVNHSSTIYKIYVLGGKVFYAVKKSTPNADVLIKMTDSNGPLLFDSLKSLPTGSRDGETSKDGTHHFDLQLVTDVATWLSRKLDLTIFGFDVVVQEGTGDHVIVDVNYLPSFKEVPDDVAVPAFWNAIRQKIESRKTK